MLNISNHIQFGSLVANRFWMQLFEDAIRQCNWKKKLKKHKTTRATYRNPKYKITMLYSKQWPCFHHMKLQRPTGNIKKQNIWITHQMKLRYKHVLVTTSAKHSSVHCRTSSFCRASMTRSTRVDHGQCYIRITYKVNIGRPETRLMPVFWVSSRRIKNT